MVILKLPLSGETRDLLYTENVIYIYETSLLYIVKYTKIYGWIYGMMSQISNLLETIK